MVATIINGRSLADAVLANIGEQVRALGQPLHLAAVCVGDDPALKAFVKLKQKAAQSVGVTFSSYLFDGSHTDEVIDTLQYLAADNSVQGMFVELPLPENWNADEVIRFIPADKDVDALREDALVPAPAVLALRYVLHEQGIVPRGLAAAVIGQGRLVGMPIARWLSKEGAQVSVVDVDTPHPAEVSARADVVVTGVGKPGLVTGEWIKEGATVIDFGYAQGTGDVDRDSVKQKAGFLTPVPGGVGPLVIAAVLENLVTLAVK